MSETLNHSEPTTSLLEDERWELVQRIAASRHLLKAPQLREILFYLSRRVLAENAASISEQEIGCKVLGRRPDFSPNEDNIVRVQVRHLRKKLDEYFNTEGQEEPLMLTIPKGAYLPRFEPRPAQPQITTIQHAEMAIPELPVVEPTGPEPDKAVTSRIPTSILLVVLGALLLTSVILWRQKEALRRNPAEEAQPLRGDPLWSRIFAPGRETSIVVADTCLVAVQDILDVDIPLNDYLSGAYPAKLIASVPDKSLQAGLQLIASRQYTSLGDATIAARLMELSRKYTAQTSIRYSRFISVREFKTGNFVLIGSRRGMPWEQLFEPQMNFFLEEDHKTRKYFFRNRAPAPGEQTTYGDSVDRKTNQDTYADVALLPNLAGTGYVLMLSGIDMAATEAAGDMITNPEFPATLTKLLKPRPGQAAAPYVEILLHAKVTAGTAGCSEIIAHRLPESPKPTS